MVFLPQVVRATYQKRFRIHLTFNDRIAARVDFESRLSGPVFKPLKRAAHFERSSSMAAPSCGQTEQTYPGDPL